MLDWSTRSYKGEDVVIGTKPFLLIAQFTVVTPEGGVTMKTDRIYTPSETACKAVEKIIIDKFNWAEQEYVKGVITKTKALGIVKTKCIPMRGVQSQPFKK